MRVSRRFIAETLLGWVILAALLSVFVYGVVIAVAAGLGLDTGHYAILPPHAHITGSGLVAPFLAGAPIGWYSYRAVNEFRERAARGQERVWMQRVSADEPD